MIVSITPFETQHRLEVIQKRSEALIQGNGERWTAYTSTSIS